MKRRDFITITGLASVAVPVLGSYSALAQSGNFTGHKFPELGYPYNALEPVIDALTMEIHYSKHHKAYFDKFMAAAQGTELLSTPMEKIFSSVSKYSPAIRNNGGGYYNHTLFWENMSPKKCEIPLQLKNAIVADFGSVEILKEKFSGAAKSHFGSGWAWLSVGEDKKLFVSSTPNQDNPLMDIADKKGIPVLAIDVWEHAYYLKYQNKRVDYVDNFWNLINWDTVNNRFLKAI